MGDRTVSAEEHVVLEKVTKRYGEATAVAGISLTIYKGEFVALIGPSGSGKTTTLRCIAGLENLTDGAIYVRGQRMDTVPPHKRDMAMVWQEYVLFPHMNLEQNIEFGLKMRGVDKETRRKKVVEQLRLVGLDVPLDRNVNQLSGGERQRVGLARALVINPQVLLLDEPLASLDRNLRVAMQSELKRIHRELGITFIYVTHNQSEALAMADRIVVMNQGRIEQIGAPNMLFGFPETRFVAEFVGENNVFEGKVLSSDPRGKVTVACPENNFHLQVEGVIPPEGTEIAFTVRADIIEMHPVDQSSSKSYDNSLRGKIVGEEYVGTIIKFTLESGKGRSLKVVKPVGLYQGSEQVILGWGAAHTHLLPWKSSRE